MWTMCSCLKTNISNIYFCGVYNVSLCVEVMKEVTCVLDHLHQKTFDLHIADRGKIKTFLYLDEESQI